MPKEKSKPQAKNAATTDTELRAGAGPDRRTTKHKKEAMLAALEKSLGIVTVAAKSAKIERKSHYRWMEKDKKYRAAVADIDEVAIDFVESKMHVKIQDGDSYLIAMYMKTKGKTRGYIERGELTGANGAPLVPEKRQVMIINGKEIEF